MLIQYLVYLSEGMMELMQDHQQYWKLPMEGGTDQFRSKS